MISVALKVCVPLIPLVVKRKPNISIEFHDTSVLHFGRPVDFKCEACLEILGNLSWIIIDKISVYEQRVPLADPRVTFSSGIACIILIASHALLLLFLLPLRKQLCLPGRLVLLPASSATTPRANPGAASPANPSTAAVNWKSRVLL
ncbi:hypothetical protein PoB_006688100 [Plakobranchus ocellatus]|uniref:Uncharacterized protein n=1 Tax=Plakobranchus ocellatus TaxID=259542 RepID=A0AAV4D899_9GAST|nr:hypothetical protein PoB_006688100 [Plakobranchus ocellatus]